MAPSEDGCARCLICGEEKPRLLLDQPSGRYFPRRIFRCSKCDGAFVYPQPRAELLSQIYGSENYFAEHLGTGDLTPAVERARIRVRVLEHLLVRKMQGGSQPRLLEVGPGNGEFLTEASRKGWNIEGLEFSAAWAQTLSERTGFHIAASDSLSAYPSVAPYDVIALWEVVEHYRDPMAELRAAFARLAPGGILALSTPNYGSLRARLYRERWRGFHEGWEHLFFFSAKSLTVLLTRAGFSRVRFISRKINSFLLTPLEWFGLGNVLEAYAYKVADADGGSPG